jgi:hypothetical protein
MKYWFAGLITIVLVRVCWAQFGLDSAPESAHQEVSPEASSGAMHGVAVKDGQTGFLSTGEDPENRFGTPLFKHLMLDQQQFWTFPFRMNRQDALVFAPFVGFTGGLIAEDSWISRQVPDSPSQFKRTQNISDYGTYSLIGAAGGSYLWGSLFHNDHMRETGLLAGEAAANSTAVALLFKTLTERPRPLQGDPQREFLPWGSIVSFRALRDRLVSGESASS